MKSSFFNSVNYDRVYSAEDWADYFKQFIGNGVYAQPDTGMQIVSDGGMDIKCLEGSCFINGYTGVVTEAEDKLKLEIGNSVYDRIDAVVARLDLNKRDIHIEVIQGLPAETPEKPEHLRTAMTFDLVLAYVTVSVGATEITDADIEDVRADEALCGFVKGIVEQIETGELFKQYKKEWALLMAGVALDEPAIIEAFKAVNSVRSVNGILPVEGNVKLPQYKVITGSYTGNGVIYYKKVEGWYGEGKGVIPDEIPETLTKEDVTINIGVTPSVVIIASSGSTGINYEKQFIVTDEFPYQYTSTKTLNVTKKECYVTHKNNVRMNADSTLAMSANSGSRNYDYSFSGSAAKVVVSDDTTPTAAQIKISDLREALLLNENVDSYDMIYSVSKKTIDDVAVGQYVFKTTLSQKYNFKYTAATEPIENGFITTQNITGVTYWFMAIVKD